MTDFFLICLLLSWPVLMMEGGRKLSRVMRDRQIDREIEENMWSES